MSRKPKLDKATVEVVKRMLALPPKHHDEMKIGRLPQGKKRSPKGRASSAKRRDA